MMHVFGPQYFLGERPPNFWNFLLLLSQIPIMWQSFTAIGRGTLKMWLPKKNICGKTEARPERWFRAAYLA